MIMEKAGIRRLVTIKSEFGSYNNSLSVPDSMTLEVHEV